MGRPWLGQLLTYVSTVYGIGEKIKQAKDERKKPQILASTVFLILLLGFLFRMESFNQLNGWLRLGRVHRLLPKGTRVPFIDAIWESLSTYDLGVLNEVHQGIVQKARRNKVFQQGTIGCYVVVGLDGVEFFESTKKCCEQCLKREKDGVTHYFHRGVGCLSVGGDPHILLGMEALHPKQDESNKDEGELTGSKRLLRRLYQEYHHFADVVVADALFANTPFIQVVESIGMDAVIRIKSTRMKVVIDALGLYKERKTDKQWTVSDKVPRAKRVNQRGRLIEIQAWDD